MSARSLEHWRERAAALAVRVLKFERETAATLARVKALEERVAELELILANSDVSE